MTPRKKTIRNLNDLARHFGCTATTVSMALRDSPELSGELKEKIRAFAEDSNFVPRSYHRRAPRRERGRYSHLGPILLLHNDYYRELNPARDMTMPHVIQLLNSYGVENSYLDIAEVKEDPGIFREFSGVIYYNDQEIEIPEELPSMQIFGWTPLKPNQDRITVDDVMAARIAVDFFRSASVKRVAMIWREDMIREFAAHPRVAVLDRKLRELGIPVTPILFSRQDTDFLERLKAYVEDGDRDIGFFAFNAVSGLKLCCALESLQLLSIYGARDVLVCDNDVIFQNFSLRPHTIDLDFPMLARRAVNGLLWRLENPGACEAVTYQTPRLVSPTTLS